MRGPLGDLHVSNALTYGSIACAVAAIVVARRGDGDLAGAGGLIAIAALLDTFDGRFARRFPRTERQQEVGRRLDSLADAVVFGLAPIAIVAGSVVASASWGAMLWWGGALIYVVATVTRLASFDVDRDSSGFVGIPAPAVGLVWSSALAFGVSGPSTGVLFVALAAAMVSPIPIARPGPLGLAAFALWAISLVAWHGVVFVR